jgi:hypothetical protein
MVTRRDAITFRALAKTQAVDDFVSKTYHQYMAQQSRSDKHEAQAFGFSGGLAAALSLVLFVGAVPFRMPSPLASVSAVVMRVFQNNDRGSTWLAFGLVWIMCATFAVGSAYVVFCVSETRKRILGRALVTRDR